MRHLIERLASHLVEWCALGCILLQLNALVMGVPALQRLTRNWLILHELATLSTVIQQSGRTDSNRQHSAWKNNSIIAAETAEVLFS